MDGDGAAELARVESEPLSAVIAEMLTNSDNNTAELMVKEIGLAASGSGTRQAGLDTMAATMASWGVDTTGLVLGDGGGEAAPLQRARHVARRPRVGVAVRQHAPAIFLHDEVVHAQQHAGSPPHLTDQERAILQELATGRSRKEVAEALHYSVNTVKTYLRSTYRKLGVGDRAEALTRARAWGLLD